MGKFIETILDRFDGGITNDPRDAAGNVFRYLANFDAITSSKRLTPYRSSESGDSAPTTSIKRNFCLALRTGTTYSLYALGVVSGTARAEILYKNLTTGSATDLDDTGWDNTSNYQAASGSANFNLFVYYRRDGHIFFGDSNAIGRYDPDGGDAIDPAHLSLTYTYIGQGIVHSKDDRLYVPYYNNAGATGAKSFIASKNGTAAFNATALTLPDDLVPTSISEYGNFLAIACAPASGIGNSRLFLWDRNESTTTLAESIDLGTGGVIIIEEVDGELIAISQKGGASSSFGFLPHGTSSHRDRVIFRRLVGNVMVKFLELQANHSGSANTTQIPLYKQKVDNRLNFQMLIELNGSVRSGVWSIGRTPGGQWALTHERTPNNDTALATGDSLRGFIVVGDYLFQSYLASSVHNTTKTDDSATYSHNSILETKTMNGRQSSDPSVDASQYKDLVEVSALSEYMPTAGSVAVAYQVDENIGTSTWTTIFTNTTDSSLGHTANNIESTGTALPKAYKEIAFRIISTGGAEVTGLRFKEEVIGKKYIAD